MDKIVVIIQARTNSSRLPYKTLLPLAGKPMLYRMVERIKNCSKINQIVIATSNTPSDEVIVDIAIESEVSFFKGSLLDVRDRHLKAAKQFDADFIVRIPADNPLSDWNEIDRLVDFHLMENLSGFSSNLAQVYASGYLDGVGAEIFSTQLLIESVEQFSSEIYKEHVHRSFFDYKSQIPTNSSWCKISSPTAPRELSRPDIVLDVNTLEDYNKIRKIYQNFYYGNSKFSIVDVISYLDNGMR